MDKSKPRVAVYYFVVPSTMWRNDGPPLFINYNLRKILNGNTKMSDDTGNVVHLCPYGDVSNFGKFDLHLLVDHGEDGLGVPLDFEYPHPCAYWVSDAHLGYEYRLNRARNFDYVFCAQKNFMEKFRKDGIPAERLFYLPHAFEPDVYKPHVIIEKYDWSFIGYLNSRERVEVLDLFCKEIPNWFLGWRNPYAKGFNELDDAARKFCQSRIVLNWNVLDDVNMRNMEILGTGKCQLTKDLPELRDLFEDGKHLVMFKTPREGVDLAKYLLSNDGMRNHIGYNGFMEASAKHTYFHRALEILKTAVGYVHSVEGGQNACQVVESSKK